MSTNIFGNAPNQVPTNADLGGMAYQDPRFVVIAGGNVNPTNFGTSNAQILAGNLTGIFNLAATAGNILTLVADNLSTGNARFTGGSITGITGAATTLVANNFSAANINMTGTTVTSGTVQITNATDSIGPSSGALRVTGGVGITANLHVGGNLFVTGNTFTLSTEDLIVQDSIIELHTFANLAPLTTNDGRDIGVKMHYYDTQDSHAFLGRSNNTGYLEWYDRGIEGFGNVFQGNTYGTFKAGGALLVNTTPSTSTTTGTLVVIGGVGVGDGLYVNGTTFLQNVSSSNIMLTGGSITGVTGAFSKLVATDFSSANIYQTGTGQSIQTANAQIGTEWGDTSRANLLVANVRTLHTTSANITTLSAPNFSSANIYQTGISQSLQTANAQIGTEWGDTSRANLLVGNVRTLHATAANITTLSAPNFSSANIYQTGTTQSIQTANAQIGTEWGDTSRANLAVGNIGSLHATAANITTLSAPNFSSANIYTAAGTVLHGAGIGSGGGVAGIGAATGGNLWIQSANLKLAPGTTAIAPVRFQSGTNLTTAEAGALEYDGFSLYVTPSVNFGRTPAVGKIFTSGIGTSGIAATTNYALFAAGGDTITLPIGTYYYTTSFQATVATSVSPATMNLALRGAGTAVGTATFDGTSAITAGGTPNQFQVAGTALTGAMVVTASSSVAGRVYVVRGSGIIKITTAGTLIPAYQWSGALTSGVVTLVADNYMTITPLSSSGTATQTGGFA